MFATIARALLTSGATALRAFTSASEQCSSSDSACCNDRDGPPRLAREALEDFAALPGTAWVIKWVVKLCNTPLACAGNASSALAGWVVGSLVGWPASWLVCRLPIFQAVSYRERASTNSSESLSRSRRSACSSRRSACNSSNAAWQSALACRTTQKGAIDKSGAKAPHRRT